MRNYSSIAVQTELVTGIDAVATSATVASDAGFPATPFTLVIDPDTVNEEIITVVARSGTNLTEIARAQDTTTAVSHGAEAVVKHMVTARDLQEPQNHIEATTNIHGVTGSLAGASNAMTFSNKTISGAENTLQDIAQSSVTGLTSALNAKAPINNPTFTGTVALPGTTSIGDVSDVEIGYLNGVTSAVQTQINDLQSEIDTAAEDILGLDAIVSENTSDIAELQTSVAGKQAADADLTALAALSTTGMVSRTGAGTFATRTIAQGANVVVVNGDGVSGSPTISVPGLVPTNLAIGDITLNFSADEVLTGTKAYGKTFTSAPVVVGVPDDARFIVAVTSMGTSSFNYSVRHYRSGVTITQTVKINWIAVQL